ncbi:bifunctional riboflavin kinase/FAD synthetase [Flaviflexus huanghaiensis]|uniref:bifunctional riboflavin kinase/FAD synthetase n=1 Tax=Flaviflexus huanghaiensis TaxID=1111473 RepID=UPI0015FC0A90|nr:bifunctional riboflavin kinase/FAD synthetase [Flaviflexus huanghaiensis]
MEVWRSAADIPADLVGSVVTVGVFDGVHRGHRAVIAETIRQAHELGLPSVVLTFDPHPGSVHSPDREVQLVISLEDRLHLLEALGVDATFVQHYTLDYAQATPEEFVRDQLVGQLRARAIVVGEDARFGRANSGDGHFLTLLGEELGVSVTLVDDLEDPKSSRRWSSTWLRELLDEGDVKGATKVLGRLHRLQGVVVHGHKRGRELGFPTANLQASSAGVVPQDGVYAGWLVRTVPGTAAVENLPAAISIGTNPQFEGEKRTVEAHVLGRADLDLYGEEVSIDLVAWLRPMFAFDTVDDLLAQMDEDLRQSALALGVPVSGRVDPAEVTAGTEISAYQNLHW